MLLARLREISSLKDRPVSKYTRTRAQRIPFTPVELGSQVRTLAARTPRPFQIGGHVTARSRLHSERIATPFYAMPRAGGEDGGGRRLLSFREMR